MEAIRSDGGANFEASRFNLRCRPNSFLPDAHEGGQRMLYILQLFVEEAFRELYDRYKANPAHSSYQKGPALALARNWKDEFILADADAIRAKWTTCWRPTRPPLWITSSPNIAARGRRRRSPPLEIPCRFYEAISEHDALTSADYFVSRDPLVKRARAWTCRHAFFALTTSEHVDVHGVREAGSPRRRFADRRALRSPSTPAPSMTT